MDLLTFVQDTAGYHFVYIGLERYSLTMNEVFIDVSKLNFDLGEER